jgi:Protein of unknown function (DUF4446)
MGIVLCVTIIAIAAAGVVVGIIGIMVGMAASRRATRAVRECNDLVQGAAGSYGTVDPKALRDVAIVRYDALNEMSGQLSFSLALLNAVGDGVVLSSINGRAETRTYAKPVVAGRGEQELSPEEAQAVHSARAGAGVPAAGRGDRAPGHAPATA